MTIWRMRIACCIPKATNTISDYVIFIACPLQRWLQERASILRFRTLPVLCSFFFIASYWKQCMVEGKNIKSAVL